MLADEQWDALGKRLRGIEQSVEVRHLLRPYLVL